MANWKSLFTIIRTQRSRKWHQMSFENTMLSWYPVRVFLRLNHDGTWANHFKKTQVWNLSTESRKRASLAVRKWSKQIVGVATCHIWVHANLINQALFILFTTTALSLTRHTVLKYVVPWSSFSYHADLYSNALQALPRHALPCKLTTSGVFPAHLCRIGSGSSFLSYASCKSGHLPVTFASNAIASSYSGLPINRAAVQNAPTRMVPQNSFSIPYSDFYRGFNHISIFNKEILGPSKAFFNNDILQV